MAPRWPQDGPKIAPQWPQDGPKVDQEGPYRKLALASFALHKSCLGKFCVTQNLLSKFAVANFALHKICPSKFCINSAKMAPGRPKVGTRWAQYRPRWFQGGFKIGPKIAQDGPKDSPNVALDKATVGGFQKQAFRINITQVFFTIPTEIGGR